jgi:aspartyl protease family protein
MNDLPAWLKHTTVWLVLAVAVFLGVQAWQAREAATRFTIDGGTVEIRRSADGHYHWRGRIEGRNVEFLVDTGATRTALPAALARELGLKSLSSVNSSTAGGVVQGTVVRADLQLDGGLQADRLSLVALPGLAAPLLGMDVLGRLRLEQVDGVLRVDLRGAGR